MNQAKPIKILYKGAEGDISPGVCMVVGEPTLKDYPIKPKMTQFLTADYCELEKKQLETVTSIVASSQIAAWVAFYRYFQERNPHCSKLPKESILAQYKKIAEKGLVIKTFGKDARGELAVSDFHFTDPPRDSSSVGYTGTASNLKGLKMAPTTSAVRIERNEPILYVRIPYTINKYAILMGSYAHVKWFINGVTIQMELLDYAGPLGDRERIEGESPIEGLSLRIVRPWSQDDTLPIRRSMAACFYKIESDSSESDSSDCEECSNQNSSQKRPAESEDEAEDPSRKLARMEVLPVVSIPSSDDEL